MQRLTPKEEEIMQYFWQHNKLFVKELLDFYSEPKPHFNTLSTTVRTLEEKGFLAHRAYGNTHQYYPVVSADEYRRGTLTGVIRKYFDNSYLSAVSSLVEHEEISLDELRDLIRKVEQGRNPPDDNPS